MTLDQLAIEDGQIAFEDQKAGKPRDVYEHIALELKGLGPNRRGTLTGNVRLDTMAAVLKFQSDFETGPAVRAKGNLTLTSDRSKDPLNVAYDVRRAETTSPMVIQRLEAKIGSLSVSATGSVNTQTTPSPLQIHANTASAPIADLMRLAALYGAKLPADLKIDGHLQADVQITGTTDKPLLAGNIRGHQSANYS